MKYFVDTLVSDNYRTTLCGKSDDLMRQIGKSYAPNRTTLCAKSDNLMRQIGQPYATSKYIVISTGWQDKIEKFFFDCCDGYHHHGLAGIYNKSFEQRLRSTRWIDLCTVDYKWIYICIACVSWKLFYSSVAFEHSVP